jgi:hypothetical protein
MLDKLLKENTTMPKYLCLIRGEALCGAKVSPSEMQEIAMQFIGWMKGMEEQGRLHGHARLHSEEGKILDGRKPGVVIDGPYAETKEIIGGYWVIDADSYEHAVELSDGIPLSNGLLEIRRLDVD